MKKLTQEVFKGLDEKYLSASIDSYGDTWAITSYKNYFYVTEDELLSWMLPARGVLVESNYDPTDWQNSAIDREV